MGAFPLRQHLEFGRFSARAAIAIVVIAMGAVMLAFGLVGFFGALFESQPLATIVCAVSFALIASYSYTINC